MTAKPGTIRTPFPGMGQHDREPLRDVGVDEDAYEHLRTAGIAYEE